MAATPKSPPNPEKRFPPASIVDDHTRPFYFNNKQQPGWFYDKFPNPLSDYRNELYQFPINELQRYVTYEHTVWKTGQTTVEWLGKSVGGDVGAFQTLGYAAKAQDRIEQVLNHIEGSVEPEILRLRAQAKDAGEVEKRGCEQRAGEWEEVIRGLKEVRGLHGEAEKVLAEYGVRKGLERFV